MKINQIILEDIQVDEGFWDDMKSAYSAGKKDYIVRKAAELGVTPQDLSQQAQAQPPGSNAPVRRGGRKAGAAPSMTKSAIRSRAKRAAGKAGAAATTTAAPTASATAPTAPKAGAPVPGMSGYVYTGKIGPSGKPEAKKQDPTTPAASATPAPTDGIRTLPTKAKSKIKPSDIDIDAVLKIADTLGPEEKKKLLQDLLKSNVKVKAGGA
jgi:hypothetical protein